MGKSQAKRFFYILPNITNLVAKSCLAWFFSSNTYNPNVLAVGGMGHSSPLAHTKTRRRYCRSESPLAVLGRAYFVNYGRFSDERHMTAEKVWHGMTLHLSILHIHRYHFPVQNAMAHFYVNMDKDCRLLTPTGTLRSREVSETVLASLSPGR